MDEAGGEGIARAHGIDELDGKSWMTEGCSSRVVTRLPSAPNVVATNSQPGNFSSSAWDASLWGVRG